MHFTWWLNLISGGQGQAGQPGILRVTYPERQAAWIRCRAVVRTEGVKETPEPTGAPESPIWAQSAERSLEAAS